jgi:hypothetical protein
MIGRIIHREQGERRLRSNAMVVFLKASPAPSTPPAFLLATDYSHYSIWGGEKREEKET